MLPGGNYLSESASLQHADGLWQCQFTQMIGIRSGG